MATNASSATRLLDFVEATARFTPPGPGAVIEDSPNHVLLAAEGQCVVGGVRLDPNEVGDAVEDVRSFMGRLGLRFAVWNVCERSTPSDLEERLLALGLTRAVRDYEVEGMVMTSAPPHGPSEVEARPVRTPAEFAAARVLLYDVFGTKSEMRMSRRSLAREFAAVKSAGTGTTYAAWLEGRIAGAARTFFAPEGALLAVAGTAE